MTKRRRKIFPSSLNPGRGRGRGTPPVARTSLVYGTDLPDFVATVFPLKSTEVTSSETVSIAASSYHSRGRQRSFSASGIRALESLVRSMMRFGSLEMTVTEPL